MKRSISTTRWCAALAGALSATGCLAHVGPYEPKERAYEPGGYADPEPGATHGSLYRATRPGLFSDTVAARTGDIITIRIDERASAETGAQTSLTRETKNNVTFDVAGILAAMAKANPDANPKELLEALSESHFSGEGQTGRASAIDASVQAFVRKVLPNGDLYLDGRKVVLLNDEEQHLYVTGVVRPQDVGEDNTVSSTRLADARIELVGRGALADNQRAGLGTRLLSWWPF